MRSAGQMRTDHHAGNENAEHNVNVASLESQIKNLLERSSSTVTKLDSQISKLDEQLSKNSATKRRKPRSPASARVIPSAGAFAAASRGAHPFNKWLVCIAGEDSSRAAESDPLHVTRPLTLDEISIVSPNFRARKLPENGSGGRRAAQQHAAELEMRERIPTTSERGRNKAVGELASSPGARMPDYSFHAPSALSSRSPFSEPRGQSQSARCRSPDLSASPIRGRREDRQDRIEASHAQPSSADEGRPGTVNEGDLRRIEERLEGKLQRMFQTLSSEVTAHSASFASKRDVEMLQSQVTQLREEMVATKSDVVVALNECRAARVAFASEHWSVKKLLEQFESFKKTHREDLLMLEQRADNAPKESGSHQQPRKSSVDHSQDGNTREGVKNLESALATLERQMSETAALTSESSSSASTLKVLMEEMFFKCDVAQQTVSRDLARYQEEALKREQGIVTRCEELERGLQKLTCRHSEADDNYARLSKDLRKTISKVDEMSSQLMTNKAQALDMQSHLLVTLDEVKDKWRSVHVQLSGQLHSTTEWSQSLRAELTSKADKALGKSAKVEEVVRDLQQALDRIFARLERNEDEIKCLDNNILHVCSCIHALQEDFPARAYNSTETPHSQISHVARGEKGVFGLPSHTQTPALSSQASRKTPRSDLSSAQSSERLLSAQSTYAAHSMNLAETQDSSHVSTGPASQNGRKRPTPIRTDSPFSSPPNLGAGAAELFRSSASLNTDRLESDFAVQRALSAANLRAAAISQSIQPVEQKLTSDSFARCKSKAVQTASVSPVIGPRHGQEKSVLAEQTGLTSLSRELYSPSNLRVMYSRRGCNGSVRSESPSPSQTLNTASAPSTPRGRMISGGGESQMCSSPVAIVTSTRPVSSQIVLPPTPQLVQFDHLLANDSPDQECRE